VLHQSTAFARLAQSVERETPNKTRLVISRLWVRPPRRASSFCASVNHAVAIVEVMVDFGASFFFRQAFLPPPHTYTPHQTLCFRIVVLCQQDPRIFMQNHNLLILERVLSPHNLKHNEASRRTRHLFNRTHEEIPVQVFSPATSSLG
jgi:hypothetical protein